MSLRGKAPMCVSGRARATRVPLTYFPVLRLALVFACCVSWYPCGVAAQESPPRPSGVSPTSLSPELEARIDAFVKRWMALRSAPGIAIGIVREGQPVYARGFGVESLSRPDDLVTANSLFHLASNSKPFVMATLLRLSSDQRIDLDAPLRRYLPYFRLDDPRAKSITARQVLSHLSGIPDEKDFVWGESEALDDGALERYVRSLGHHSLLSAPGDEFHYSNMAFEVLGDVIAKITGTTFENAVRRELLQPLGMTHSSFLLADLAPEFLTDPHDRSLVPFVSPVRPYNRMHAPSSTLYSSAAEMCNWMLMNLARGSLGDQQVLPPQVHSQMFREIARTGSGGYDDHIGLTWFLGAYRGRQVVSHKGRDLGYGSMVMMIPEEGLGVVVLGNAHFAPIGQLTEGIVDLLLGHEPPRPQTSARYAIGPIIADSGVQAGLDAYTRLEEEHCSGYVFGPSELALVGDDVTDELGAAAGLEVFLFNVAHYPKDASARVALGEAYLRGAIDAFRQALELDPEESTAAEALRRLQR